MMKRKVLFVLTIILLISSINIIKAQQVTSGYLGKKFHFKFNTMLSPAWSNPDFNGDKGFFKFNYNFMPGIEYVVGKRSVLGINYQIFKTQFERKDNATDIIEMIGLGDVKVQGFSVYWKGYQRERSAPMGFYAKHQLDFYFYDVTCNVFKDPLWENSNPEIIPYEDKSWSAGYRIEFGRTFFLGEYFSLETGISAGIATGGYMFDRDDATPVDWAARRLRMTYLFGISFGIGIMPF